ncbi:MAG TPA: glycosyltransferase family 4 protein [Candidatus Saccharimonadales bacterium]|nr:glycosyltransferase family 4 protein [Candidatus Saccharimonadales bacterium]
MKIGLVLPYSIARGGGVQEILFAMQRELDSRGHEAYIITPRPQGYDQPCPEHVLLVGASTDFNSPTHTTAQVSAGLNEDIDRVLTEHDFDVLHFHEPWIPILARQILTRSTSANVATFHAAIPDTIMSRTLAKVVTPYTKPLLKYIDEFTAVSEPAAEYICSLIDEPVALIPNAVDLKQFKPPKYHNDKKHHKTILYVGRLEGRKGVKFLLHAYKLLSEQDPDLSLVIFGNGPDKQQLEMLATDLELPRVQFPTDLSHKAKIKWLRSADLFCAPSPFGESFGLVLLEAMATELVTVAGDNPGYASVMQGLGALSLVNPRQTAELARRLELLLRENDLRRLWRDWAKKEIQQYTYANVASQYEEVYVQAQKKHHRKQ